MNKCNKNSKPLYSKYIGTITLGYLRVFLKEKDSVLASREAITQNFKIYYLL